MDFCNESSPTLLAELTLAFTPLSIVRHGQANEVTQSGAVCLPTLQV